MNAPIDPRVALSELEFEFRQAFARIVRNNLGFVRSVLRRYGVEASALDDLSQDVFLTVYQSWGRKRSDVDDRAWLFGIARRKAANHRKKLARRPRIAAQPEEAWLPGMPVSSQNAERKVLEAELQAELDKLSPKLRDVYVLSEIWGMSYIEVGEALQIRPKTATSRLRSARLALAGVCERHAAIEARVAGEGSRELHAAMAAREDSRAHGLLLTLLPMLDELGWEHAATGAELGLETLDSATASHSVSSAGMAALPTWLGAMGMTATCGILIYASFGDASSSARASSDALVEPPGIALASEADFSDPAAMSTWDQLSANLQGAMPARPELAEEPRVGAEPVVLERSGAGKLELESVPVAPAPQSAPVDVGRVREENERARGAETEARIKVEAPSPATGRAGVSAHARAALAEVRKLREGRAGEATTHALDRFVRDYPQHELEFLYVSERIRELCRLGRLALAEALAQRYRRSRAGGGGEIDVVLAGCG